MRSQRHLQRIVAAMLLSSMVAHASRASAQSTTAITINTGFSPDPGMLRGTAGGAVEGARIGDDCRGFFPQRPQHRITTNGVANVRFFTIAPNNADITLAIVGPNNSINCDDDSGGNNQALLDMRLPAGSYDVYVGTYRPNEPSPYGLVFTTNGQLRADAIRYTAPGGTQTPPNTPPNGSSPWNTGQTPPNTGQTPPPNRGVIDRAATLRPSGPAVRVRAGGTQRARGRTTGSNDQASALRTGCAGFVTLAPSHAVVLSGASSSLRFNVTSAADTTLIVRAPNGQVMCNDDAVAGNFNPEVSFPTSITGTYAVWVGTYRPGMRNLYQLTVTAN
jgi:hypothetical protein